MYCHVCLQTLRDRPQGLLDVHNGVRLLHHQTYSSFKSSAASCAICTRLWEKVSSLPTGFGAMVEDWIAQGDNEPPPEALPDRSTTDLDYCHQYYATTLEILKNKDAAAAELDYVKFCIEAKCYIPPTASHLHNLSAADDYECIFDLVNVDETHLTDSPTNFFQFDDNTFAASPRRIATSWINECVSGHPVCLEAGSMDPGWLPTRLIDVGQQGKTHNVRVITTASEPGLHGSLARYATLSHCWGTASFLTLTKSRFSALSRNIPLADLPRTFQEAITVCRHLSISYIWIDSLCIIQDDIDDWLVESVEMQKVYANGFINIAAGASQDSSQGLFRQRDPSQSPVQPALEIDLQGVLREDSGEETGDEDDEGETDKDDEGETDDKGHEVTEDQEQQTTKTEDKQLHRCFLVSRDEWMNNVEQSTLAMRGWVLQERLLSPRILIFGTRQIYWQCFQSLHVEEGTPMIRSMYTKDIKNIFGQAFKRGGFEGKQEEKKELLRLWNRVVMVYSRTQLTKSTDRLVALSGLAKAFSRKLPQDKYLAGMWQNNLHEDLLWYCDFLGGCPSAAPSSSSPSLSLEETEYCAPTFCWASASLPHGIWMDGEKPRGLSQFTVLDLQLTHKTDDTTGPVTSGHLDIQGKLLRVGLSSTSSSAASNLGPGKVPVEINFGPDDDSDHGDPFEKPQVHFDRALELPNNASRLFYFLVAQVDEWIRSDDEDDDSDDDETDSSEDDEAPWVLLRATCMLLELVEAKSGIYRRIGLVVLNETFHGPKGDDLENPVHWLLKTCGLPGAAIPNRGRSGEEYIIRII
ncbi:hypothetical protein PspLS_08229 [Pyricularia sp. CBS 133598]|nr:hypothetical protein PspLS_08229 [Pyricularia sp. CBS 133598]